MLMLNCMEKGEWVKTAGRQHSVNKMFIYTAHYMRLFKLVLEKD